MTMYNSIPTTYKIIEAKFDVTGRLIKQIIAITKGRILNNGSRTIL